MKASRAPVSSRPGRGRRLPGRVASVVVTLILGHAVAVSGAASRPGADPAGPGPDRLTAEAFHVPDLQLRELISTLLAGNPGLDSLRARSRSTFERVAQSGSLPDPGLAYRYYASSPETRVGPQEHMIEIHQGVPWHGKRRLEASRTESLAIGVTWEIQDLERQHVAELKKAYFEIAYLQEALVVNREERELLRRFESIALRKYSTGQGIQQTVIKVQTELSRLEDQRVRLRERHDSLHRRISELIGRPEERLVLAPVELRIPELDGSGDDLEQRAVSMHPRVRSVEQRVEADRLWAQSRRLESRPDFRFGVGYTLVGDREDAVGVLQPPEDNGTDVWALTVGVNLPIRRKRIRAGVAEARESEQAHARMLESVRDRLRFEIQESLLRVESLAERCRWFRDVIIPQAEESLASAEAAYAADRLGFLDLLDAQRTLFRSRLSYHQMVSDLWVALADLERSAGEPFPPAAPPIAGGLAQESISS